MISSQTNKHQNRVVDCFLQSLIINIAGSLKSFSFDMRIYFLTLDGCVSHLVSTYFRPISHDHSYVVCPFCGYGISFSMSLFISQWHLLLCVQCFSHSLWLDDASVRNSKILFCKHFLLINLNNLAVKSKLKLLQNEMFSGLLGSDCRGFGLFACD